MNVAILGASIKEDRLSNMAQARLTNLGHQVFPVTPIYDEVLGVPCYTNLIDIKEKIDTITVYLAPDKTRSLIQQFMTLNPRRVILNPGTESTLLTKSLEENGIQVLEACTLVMLSSSSF